jgi:4-hydroxybenzoate polyprenyltransferase
MISRFNHHRNVRKKNFPNGEISPNLVTVAFLVFFCLLCLFMLFISSPLCILFFFLPIYVLQFFYLLLCSSFFFLPIYVCSTILVCSLTWTDGMCASPRRQRSPQKLSLKLFSLLGTGVKAIILFWSKSGCTTPITCCGKKSSGTFSFI